MFKIVRVETKFQSMNIELSKPAPEDGALIHQLVAKCPPLDPNSSYCNLLQATHFSDTCVIAKDESGEVVGFVSGYRLPSDPTAYFLWQVAVGEKARGMGLAKKMIDHILARPEQARVNRLLTTVTKDNEASRNMFKGWAKARGVAMEEGVFFDKERHFLGQHDSEFLIKIGPLTPATATNSTRRTSNASI